MQKQAIRSLIRNSLPKYDKAGRFGDRYINRAIEKVIAGLYEEVWRMNPLNLQRYTKQYGYSTAITINTDLTTGRVYCTLPASIVPFQDRLSGCRRISTITQGAAKFFPVDPREMDLLANGSYSDTVTNMIGYSVGQNEIEFYNMSPAIQAQGVRMDLIVPFSEYDEDEEVKIPEIETSAGTRYNASSQSFVDKVMQILGIAPKVDTKDDNRDQQGLSNKDN